MIFIAPKCNTQRTLKVASRKKFACFCKFLGRCTSCGVKCHCIRFSVFRKHELHHKYLISKRKNYTIHCVSSLLTTYEKKCVINDRSLLFYLNDSDLTSDDDSDTSTNGGDSDSSSDANMLEEYVF